MPEVLLRDQVDSMKFYVNKGDPIGVIDVTCLQRWGSTAFRKMTDYGSLGEPPRHKASPFPCSTSLNNKICLWEGDITTLNVDGIVHPTNESMTERTPLSDRIHWRAGAGLHEEIKHDIKECRTGEVRVTNGHGLPARFVIHTVGPRYNIKYRTAAENTLYTCYRNALQKAKELCLASVGLTVINSVRKNYPPDEGAHLAIRTVRRFLETYPDAFEVLVFVVDEPSERAIYEVLLPLYFPRSKEEEDAARWQLPVDVGGSRGEPVTPPDRQIRIIDNPQHRRGLRESPIRELDNTEDLCLHIGEHEFSQMQGDLDQQRLLGTDRPPSDPLEEILVKELHQKERKLIAHRKTTTLEIQ